MENDLPTRRWGIVATGSISTHFVRDLTIDRSAPLARHVIQAIGSSSIEKGKRFASELLPGKPVTVYGTYNGCYDDPNVDIVYIGTPHAFHKQNCLDAIHAGKHVLCEKPFTLNTKEAEEVLCAAEAKGVFVMEGVWTRHFPITKRLQQILHEERLIGDITRVFCDFSLDLNLKSLGPDSRLKNPALGAGSLLDIGIYSITWALIALQSPTQPQNTMPKVLAAQTLMDGTDIATSAILLFPGGKQALVTSSNEFKTAPHFCQIQGSDDYVVIEGPASSVPVSFTIYSKHGGDNWEPSWNPKLKCKRFEFQREGKGFHFEADTAAVDIQAGLTQSLAIPWNETKRVLAIMDEIRRQGEGQFPQD
ncbi:dimeric dihydrodiol dehydrogenase [Penicillium herquei]|nr:dimeric dihydrodiol dehydrogenase [Penicillium herquei]